MAIWNNQEKEKWIEVYVEKENAVARRRVYDAETAITQEQEDMTSGQRGGLTFMEPGQPFENMLDAIRGSLSDHACSDDQEHGEQNGVTQQSKRSKVDEPGWVMGTIPKMVQQSMEGFRKKQMKVDEVAQLEWGDTAVYFLEGYN